MLKFVDYLRFGSQAVIRLTSAIHFASGVFLDRTRAQPTNLAKFAGASVRNDRSRGSRMTHTDSEKRQHPRFDIPLEGVLHTANADAPFRVRNISAGGAMIEVEANLRPGHLIKIEIPEIGMFDARMTRMNWKFAGICLEDGEEKVGAFISEWLEGNPEATQAH